MSIFQQVFGGGFDSNSVEPQQDFDVLPPGKYLVVVEKAEVKTTKKGDGHYLEVCVRVTDGPHAKRKLWSRMNIDNPSEVATRIGLSQLSGLCKACGLQVINSENDLLGKSCIANVKVKDDQNEIRSWSGASPGTQGTTVFAPPTTPVNPAPTDNQHTGQQAAAPTGNKPPWAR